MNERTNERTMHSACPFCRIMHTSSVNQMPCAISVKNNSPKNTPSVHLYVYLFILNNVLVFVFIITHCAVIQSSCLLLSFDHSSLILYNYCNSVPCFFHISPGTIQQFNAVFTSRVCFHSVPGSIVSCLLLASYTCIKKQHLYTWRGMYLDHSWSKMT